MKSCAQLCSMCGYYEKKNTVTKTYRDKKYLYSCDPMSLLLILLRSFRNFLRYNSKELFSFAGEIKSADSYRVHTAVGRELRDGESDLISIIPNES